MRTFLAAEWRHLLMLNYAVDPALLRGDVPRGLELDSWNGTTYVTMVGFMFCNTRVMGVPIPWHRTFEEINFRFYVRRRCPEGWRRGVVFIREIVPRRAVATVARLFYGEPYRAMRMSHRIETEGGEVRAGSVLEYSWRYRGHWNRLAGTVVGQHRPLEPGSEAEFITEHYWGYSARHSGFAEYRVAHDQWHVASVTATVLDCDVAELYGPRFVDALHGSPHSAFAATGSAVAVSWSGADAT